MASRRVAAHAYARVAELRRDLTLIDAIGIGFGAIVGAGIFVVTGVAAGSAGPAFLISLFIAAIAAAANALSSAQLGAEYPQAGGTYEYGHQLLHPWAGFAAGWMFVASKIAAAGTVALGLAGYVDALVPGVWSRVIAVGAIVAFTVLNYLGVKRSSRANLAIVTISVGALLLFVVVGAAAFRFENLRPFAPRAIVLTVSSVALLYMAVAVVAVGARRYWGGRDGGYKRSAVRCGARISNVLGGHRRGARRGNGDAGGDSVPAPWVVADDVRNGATRRDPA
jgi:amino acid transporter